MTLPRSRRSVNRTSVPVPGDDAALPGVSAAAWNPVPAGRDGFVTAKGSHLYVGGRRIRFLGVNCCFSANFPGAVQAAIVADRLARLGVNCVRFHHLDTEPAPDGLLRADRRTPDDERFGRLDEFIARLKERGIYCDLNLHVGRVYPDQPPWDGMPRFCAGVDTFFPPMIEAQREYARLLLTHVNPFTGNAYAAEPAVAFVEINNENSLPHAWFSGALDTMPDPYAAELHAQWNRWLRNFYHTDERLRRDWAVAAGPEAEGLRPGEALGRVALFTTRDFARRSPEARRAWSRFLYDSDERYWTEMARYLREELGVRSLIIGTAAGWSPPPVQARLDVVDGHAYWRHPEYPGRPWDPVHWIVRNDSMAGTPGGGCVVDLALCRMDGRPFVVTEYNHPAPNTFSSEAFLLLAAYGALQDWDGIFAFAWSHREAGFGSGRIENFFDIAGHPLKIATLPVAAALFRRGDVQPPKRRTVVAQSREGYIEMLAEHGPRIDGRLLGIKRDQALRHPVAMALNETGENCYQAEAAREEPRIVSDNGQLVWDTAGVVEIRTPRSAGLVGRHGRRPFTAQNLRVRDIVSRQNWATLTLTALDGADLARSRRMLLVATGLAENTGMKWKTPERSSVGADWGEAPVLVEGIAAHVELPSAAALEVWALNERGERRQAVPTAGRAFRIGPAFRTIWYEVLRKE